MTDIEGFVNTLLMLVVIDAFSLVISATFLYITCKINMIQVRQDTIITY